jgi:hypothetical protein
MTEPEWLACADPQQMLDCLHGQASDRKLRLFAVACCRRIWTLVDKDCRHLGVRTEDYADGQVSQEELLAARDEAHDSDWTAGLAFEEAAALEDIEAAAGDAAGNAAHAAADAATDYLPFREQSPAWAAARQAEFAAQAALLQEVFGNPFRPVSVERSWLTATVVALAQAIYEERAFDRLPILADALEDAGCDNADLLNHCRQPGEHVRACWAVDLLLGKK